VPDKERRIREGSVTIYRDEQNYENPKERIKETTKRNAEPRVRGSSIIETD
jgi:hypothetical protein